MVDDEVIASLAFTFTFTFTFAFTSTEEPHVAADFGQVVVRLHRKRHFHQRWDRG